MTVIIAGAGIGGLTLGLTLHSLGIPFHIVEAAETLRPLGLGINLQPHAVREFQALGLDAALSRIGIRTGHVSYFNDFGQKIWSEPRGAAAGYRWPQYSVHRGDLQITLFRSLLRRAGPDCVMMGAAVHDLRLADDGVEVTLCNPRRNDQMQGLRGRLLVGADGINSIVRARLFPGEGRANWGGTIMWRGLTRGPHFLDGRTMAVVGTRARKFVCYPIAETPEGGSLVNWVADLRMSSDYPWSRQDWTRAGRREDFAPRFADMQFPWLDIPALIDGAQNVLEFPMVDRDPLPQWSHGPVTLMGDAAHAMYPAGSNGASQAIVDARYLGRALRDNGLTTTALRVYEDARRAAANALVLANRADGPDQILDLVAARAPEGFDDIENVMPVGERKALADGYKKTAGMEVAALNARPSLLEG